MTNPGPPSPSASSARKRDLFRQTPLRYVAFSNDVGEAFKPFIGRRLYLASYAVAAGYGLLDASTRAVRAYGIGAEPQQPVAAPPAGVQLAGRAPAPPLHASSARESAGELGPAGSALAEAVVWHGLASLLVPGVAVNRTVWAATRLVTRLPRLPALAARALPAAAGLLAIPLLVPHIDVGVDTWMDRSVRPALAPSEWKQAE